MREQLQLIYPDSPGWKGSETSRRAAMAMRGKASTIAEKILVVLKGGLKLTADELAKFLRISILSVRPRCSELFDKGLIKDTGIRRRNLSGLKATVWEIKNEK